MAGTQQRIGGHRSGICLTFDDWFVRGWYGARGLFERYDARATFFVSKPDRLDRREWRQLRALQADGHEIGCHTLSHVRLIKYLRTHSFEDYISDEILPALEILRDEGMEVNAFSYPYFKYRPQLTGMLLGHFRMVREAGEQGSPVHAIYPMTGNVNVNVMGKLDRTGYRLGMEYYEERFGLLRDHGGVGYFCGHALGPDRPKDRAIICRYEDLEEVLASARDHGLEMLPMRETGFRFWGAVGGQAA